MSTDNFRKHTSQNQLQRYFISQFTKVLLDELALISPVSLLDVGCGEGFVLRQIKDAGITNNLEGIEYLDRAIELGKQHNPGIKILHGSIYQLPYKNNSWDSVLCTEVLEHLDDPAKGLAELTRVAKKHVILSVPNEPVFILSNFLRGKNWSRWGNDIEHINHWSRWGFEKFVSKELYVEKIRNPFPWTLIVASKR